jgi:hypothetical protein
MNTLFRIAASALAVAIPVAGMVPAAMAAAYSPFAKYFSEKPDFVIEQAFQYDNSYSYFVRVCNRGDTPVSGGTLRISIGRDNSDREERYYSGVTPASGSCSNFEIANVRKYGLKSSRTYGLTASVWWNGASGESALTNNSKNIPASPTAKTVPNSTDSYSWTKPPVTSTYSDPVNDLYLDRPNNPYSGRTWYYYSGTNYDTRCRGYWDASGNWRSYETHAVGSACYYDPYAPNSSGYYWYSTPANGYVPPSNSTDYRWDPVTGSYRSDFSYDQSYYGYPYSYPTSNVYADSTPNFYVSRFERDGSSRNLLATVCNNGGSMSTSRDLTVSFRDLSRNTPYKVSPYVQMRAGECRDFAVSFSNFPSDYSAYRTFEVTVDPDNRIYERSENDNSARANVWMER